MSADAPRPWPEIAVADAIGKRRGQETRKLKTTEYGLNGALPIVDQGSDLICGYTDDLDAAYPYELPVVVFGDHTRRLKFVDFPFAIGADGTQCLHPIDGLDPYFFYYALDALDLQSEGYARHFKLLKEKRIPLPDIHEQRRIAEVLRSLDVQIAAQERVLSKLRDVQSAAFSLFLRSGEEDETARPISGWTTGRIEGVTRLPPGWRLARLVEIARLESGHTPSRKEPSYWANGAIGWISLHDTQNLERPEITSTELSITEEGLKNSSARLLPPGTVCFSRTATVGKCVIMGREMATSQDFANFVCSSSINNKYLLYLLRWMQPVWKQLASGSTHKTIYMPTFERLQIVLPTREAQDGIVEAMDALTASIDEGASVHSQLCRSKAALASDLLSGRVRVPA